MKKYGTYCMLSGLIFTNLQISPAIEQLSKKEIIINTLKHVGNKTVLYIAPLGNGFNFAGQKITQHKKLIFISAGLASLTGLSLYLNSNKIKDSKKPEALFGKNKSFNPFNSNLVQKMCSNLKDGFNILDAVRILLGMNPMETAAVQILKNDISMLSNSSMLQKEELEKLTKEKEGLSNQYTTDTSKLNLLITNSKNENIKIMNEKEDLLQKLEASQNKIDLLTTKLTNKEKEYNEVKDCFTGEQLKNNDLQKQIEELKKTDNQVDKIN